MLLAECLLNWYDANKRNLPWRQDQDPYKIWVSEIMLQQTRVEVVAPYFERWLKRFPTMEELGAASEEEVLLYWQGLGYYSRARNLLQGVREAQALYGGKVPDSKEQILGLSGVGEYTAGAILSMAYGKPECAVDGNVMRIYCRLYCIDEDVARSSVKRKIAEMVCQDMDIGRPGDFNQALMDLGAAICSPKIPRCDICPLKKICRAFGRGCQGDLPSKRKRTPPVTVEIAAAVISEGDKYLLHKRPAKGLLAGMWEFPVAEGEQVFRNEFASSICSKTGCKIRTGEIMLSLVHIFSHQRWNINFYQCLLEEKEKNPLTDYCWIDRGKWENLSFAGPHRKMALLLTK